MQGTSGCGNELGFREGDSTTPRQGKEKQHTEKVYTEKHQAPGHPRTFTLKRFTNKEAD